MKLISSLVNIYHPCPQMYEHEDLGGGPVLTNHLAIKIMGKSNQYEIELNQVISMDANDLNIMILEHENGSTSEINLNFFSKKYNRKLEVFTSKEYYSIEPFGRGLESSRGIEEEYSDFDFNQTYISAVFELLENKTKRLPTKEEMYHLMDATDALIRSASQK